MIFNEDYLNTQQIEIFKAHMAAPPRNQTTNINNEEGAAAGSGAP
jgi:hypothetical protein